MKKRAVSIMLAAVLGVSLLAGCGSGAKTADSKTTDGTAQDSAASETKTAKDSKSGDAEVLEFYHGYYHDESEWPAAKVMRDIYDEFAAKHADGPVTFKPIAVEDRAQVVSAKVAGGSFPDMVDCDKTVPQTAISQELVLDLKPYIDENNLKDAVGLNYTQNDVDGHIYTVHDQIESRGIWYNLAMLEKAGVKPEEISTWAGFEKAMESVRSLTDGTYGYAAGQGSLFMVNAILASTEEGKKLLSAPLTEDVINSETFSAAFKQVAKYDQANGSDHTTEDLGNMMDDFNKNGMAAVLLNGVWNASGIDQSLMDTIEPTIYPENVAIASAGAGLTIASGMSDAKTELALEFLKYMTSAEVQSKIFTGVQANPCNNTIDLNKLAEESGEAGTLKLAEACSQVNNAKTIVTDLSYVWGSDVRSTMINALMECAVDQTDIDARFQDLQKELIALIG